MTALCSFCDAPTTERGMERCCAGCGQPVCKVCVQRDCCPECVESDKATSCELCSATLHAADVKPCPCCGKEVCTACLSEGLCPCCEGQLCRYCGATYPEPSLSASIAKILLEQSPLHAWTAHPRLNPNFTRVEDEKFDLGTAAHAYLLQGETAFALIDAPDWRTKAAKEARDAARLAGKVPLLRHRWEAILEMAAAANRQLDQHEDGPRPFSAGKPEQTLVWKECGVWCRARLDWLFDDHSTIDDYKSTAASAHPDAWTRQLFGMGADVQAAFYLRGLKAITGKDATFRFVAQENTAPFALSVIALMPASLALASRKVDRAVEIFGACLKSGRWPAYPTRTCYVEIPPFLETQWLERELREESAA